jgi:hypothetical protein
MKRLTDPELLLAPRLGVPPRKDILYRNLNPEAIAGNRVSTYRYSRLSDRGMNGKF